MQRLLLHVTHGKGLFKARSFRTVMLRLIALAGGNGCGVQWLTYQQRGCQEEENCTLRLAIADSLLEGHSSEGGKERPHSPYCFLMGGNILRQWLWLQHRGLLS